MQIDFFLLKILNKYYFMSAAEEFKQIPQKHLQSCRRG